MRSIALEILECISTASWRRLRLLAIATKNQLGIERLDSFASQRYTIAALAYIRDKAKFRTFCNATSQLNVKAAFNATAAAAHLNLCEQNVLLGKPETAKREAMATIHYSLAALQASGYRFTAAEEKGFLLNTHLLPNKIETQYRLRVAIKSGLIPKKIAFVLGMHRSGTSATAGMLCELGLDPPRDLMPAGICNPKGYYESIGITKENDRLLSLLGTSWRLEEELPACWAESYIADRWRNSLLKSLHRSFFTGSFPVLKDPRFCTLMSGLQCWGESDLLDCRFVIPIRHPVEVTRSLLCRPEFPIDSNCALKLWIRSVLDSIFATWDSPRIILLMEDMFTDPENYLQKLAVFTGMQQDQNRKIGRKSRHFEKALRHNDVKDLLATREPSQEEEFAPTESLAIRIYEHIKKTSGNPDLNALKTYSATFYDIRQAELRSKRTKG